MSYILDALRKAEAERERERGTVPHLMAQPLGTAPAPPAARTSAWRAAGVGLALVAAVATGWWLAPQTNNPGGTPAAPVAAHTPGTPMPQAALPPAQPLQPATPTGNTAPNLAALDPAPRPPKPATETPVLRADTGMPPASTLPAPAVLEAPAPARATPSRTVAYDQLPADVRRQLPPLNLGGAIYSDTPSARMLLVNGQLQREGDNVAPGVVLEQIQPRSAVLRWRDLRYEMTW